MSNLNPLSRLSSTELNTLIERLLNCRSMQDGQSRDAVLNLIPAEVRSRISRSTTTRVDVLNILRTCGDYPQGLAQLVEAVRFFEGPAYPMQALDNTLSTYGIMPQAPASQSNGDGGQPEPSPSTPQTVPPVVADNKTSSQPPMQVFLCHADTDEAQVYELYEKLQQDHFAPWLKEVNLLPGQTRELEVKRAIRSSGAFIICLSASSTNLAGLFNKEIRFAKDIAAQQPEGTIYLIPIRLDECEVPENLEHLSWLDLFKNNNYNKLLQSLRIRQQQLTKSL